MKRKQVEKYHKAPEGKKAEIECNPYAIFHQALENCKPVIGLASIQKGGKFYQVSTLTISTESPGSYSLVHIVAKRSVMKTGVLVVPPYLSFFLSLVPNEHNLGVIVCRKIYINSLFSTIDMTNVISLVSYSMFNDILYCPSPLCRCPYL